MTARIAARLGLRLVREGGSASTAVLVGLLSGEDGTMMVSSCFSNGRTAEILQRYCRDTAELQGGSGTGFRIANG